MTQAQLQKRRFFVYSWIRKYYIETRKQEKRIEDVQQLQRSGEGASVLADKETEQCEA